MGRHRLNRFVVLFRILALLQCGTFFSLSYLPVGNLQQILRTPTTISARDPIVDALVVGSNSRRELLRLQRAHLDVSNNASVIRRVFFVSEEDDPDPFCATDLSKLDVSRIVKFCRNRRDDKREDKWNRLNRHFFAPTSILAKQINPAGWLCAQSRPAVGLAKVVDHYQQSHHTLPDYLMILDDDTHVNLDRLRRLLVLRRDVPSPLALAGCILQFYRGNILIPHGGFGILWNRELLLRIMQPYVPYLHSRHSMVVHQVPHRSGAYMVDWILELATGQKFREFRNWTTGSCFHSDWLWGYMHETFNISRLELLEESMISKTGKANQMGFCGTGPSQCSNQSVFCHHLSSRQLYQLQSKEASR